MTQAVPMAGAPSGWGKFFSLDNKYIAPIFITAILVVGNLSFGMLESYRKTGIAIIASLITELILSKIYMGKWPILASAYITGISVGILVRSPAVWPYLVCAVVSIMSKYVLRVNNRHIWNPSNFGISVLLFLAP
jgi:Na+-transporting NADH:ubiquinone oxidoreductase subunit NqrB